MSQRSNYSNSRSYDGNSNSNLQNSIRIEGNSRSRLDHINNFLKQHGYAYNTIQSESKCQQANIRFGNKDASVDVENALGANAKQVL